MTLSDRIWHVISRLFVRVSPILICVGIIGSVPYLFAFVPSTDWAHLVRYWAFAGGFLGLVSLPFGVLHYLIRREQRDIKTSKQPELLGGALFVMIALVFGYSIGSSAVTAGIPILASVLSGQQTELAFIVEDKDGSRRRFCLNPIELEDLPYNLDELCGFNSKFRDSLIEGNLIYVRGYGTNLGVFVKSARY